LKQHTTPALRNGVHRLRPGGTLFLIERSEDGTERRAYSGRRVGVNFGNGGVDDGEARDPAALVDGCSTPRCVNGECAGNRERSVS